MLLNHAQKSDKTISVVAFLPWFQQFLCQNIFTSIQEIVTLSHWKLFEAFLFYSTSNVFTAWLHIISHAVLKIFSAWQKILYSIVALETALQNFYVSILLLLYFGIYLRLASLKLFFFFFNFTSLRWLNKKRTFIIFYNIWN